MQTEFNVLVVDPHAIYRCGLATCLRELDEVGTVAEATSVAEALEHEDLAGASVVVLDHDLPGAQEFVRKVGSWNANGNGNGHGTRKRVIVCSARCEQEKILAAVQAGAVGFLVKDTLTPEALAGGVRAASHGTGVLAPELMSTLLDGLSRVSREVLEPRGLTLSRLNEREQSVLSLIADGHPIREIADQLCYSERTVKNVLHDVITKLNVRTRSQAIAHAVREGLI